jgi:hypothetical protein
LPEDFLADRPELQAMAGWHMDNHHLKAWKSMGRLLNRKPSTSMISASPSGAKESAKRSIQPQDNQAMERGCHQNDDETPNGHASTAYPSS